MVPTTKRGQVTVFIIVGLLLVAVVGLLFAYRGSTTAEIGDESLFLDVSNVELYVSQCLEQTAAEAIIHTGKSGGYFLLPEPATTELLQNVPYYYDLGQDFFPTDEQFAQEIAHYVDVALPFCLNDFQPFAQQGYTISAEKPSSTVRLGTRKLNIKTNLPITVAKGVQARDLSVFSVDVEAEQLFKDIGLAREVVRSQSGPEVCLSCFADAAESNDIFVGIIPIAENSYLIDMTDNDYSIQNENYHLRFAVRYPLDET